MLPPGERWPADLAALRVSRVKLGDRRLRNPLQHLLREDTQQLPADVEGLEDRPVLVRACGGKGAGLRRGRERGGVTTGAGKGQGYDGGGKGAGSRRGRERGGVTTTGCVAMSPVVFPVSDGILV